jgi:hypothetical protein
MTNIYDEYYQKEAIIFVDGMEYVVKRIDIHHFSMGDPKRPGHPAIWHKGILLGKIRRKSWKTWKKYLN